MKAISLSKRLITYLAVLAINAPSWPIDPQVVIPANPIKLVTLPGESATRLPSGNWLLLGGEGKIGVDDSATLASVYTSAVIKLSQGLSTPRAWHTATILPNGTALILGGIDTNGSVVPSAEVFDPASSTFRQQTTSLIPRAHHSAALLSDGRLFVAGGTGSNGDPVTFVEIYDPRTGKVTLSEAELPVPRLDDHPLLLADGTILLSGGTDPQGNLLNFAEIYDPVADRFMAATTTESSQLDLSRPFLEDSLPEDGALNVSSDALIALRFSKLLRPDTVTSGTIQLQGPSGAVPCLTVPAENGRVAFITPTESLLPATAYTVVVQGATDEQHLAVVYKSISFTTAGSATAADNTPTTAPAASPAPSRSSSKTIPKAPANVTAVAGQVLRLNGSPLPNVTLRIKNRSVRSDTIGRFLLTNALPGQQDLVIDGRTASLPGHAYGVFETGVQVIAGHTVVLPFTIWMTELDMVHAVSVKFPTTQEVIITTPTLPGLEFHIPPHTIITDIDGKVATQISITSIPLKQPPFPLPEVEVPIYFTIQPGGGSIWVNGGGSTKGAWLVYPNIYNWPVGRSVNFWNYDPYTSRGWYIYGQGKVAADRKSIIPNPGTEIYQLTGAMVAGSGWAPPSGPPGLDWGGGGGGGGGNGGGPPVPKGGEPVDLSTGLFVYEKTDLYLPDVIPISLTRVYRNDDTTSRAFGIGTTLPYDMFIVGDLNDFSWVELVLPNGGRVRFDRTQGNYWNTSTLQCTTTPGAFYGATFTTSAPGWSGSGAFWVITLRDGTVMNFLQPGNIGPQNYQAVALSSITDRNGNTVHVYRNSNNYITQIQSPNGRWIQLSYDSNNPPRVISAQDSAGRVVGYSYDPTLGTLDTVTDANQGVWTYGYDPSYEMTSIEDARQIIYLQNTYVNGRVTQQILSSSQMLYSFNYVTDSNNNVTQTTVTDPNGNVRQVTFASPQTSPDGVFVSGGYATEDIHALGKPEQQVFTYSIDPTTNFLLSETDSLNRTTSYTYDSLGNTNSITQLAGTSSATTTFYSHDPSYSQLSSITDPLNHTTTIGLDSHANIVSVTDPLGNASLFANDLEGRLIEASDALGNTWQLGYTGADLTLITDPYGQKISFARDEAGRVVASTDALGQTSKYKYNPLNRLTQSTDPLGEITQFGWDPNGNLLSVTDARNTSNPTTYTYDNMDRIQTRTDPLGKQEVFAYDANGNLNCFTDRRGQVANLTYDGLDRITSIGYGATSCTNTTYQSTTSYSYDAGSRPTQIVDSVSGAITPVFDGLNRLMSVTTPQGSVSYQYDAGSRETSMTVAGQPPVNYTYDMADRVTQVAQGSATVGFSYDADSRRTSLILPIGVTTSYSYDKDSRLTNITYNQGSLLLGNLTYAYDPDGQVLQESGNFARTGLPAAVTSGTYDAANRLTVWGTNSAFSYDANGNLLSDGTNAYSWDARNQLSAIRGGSTAQFQYDPFGRRIKKMIAGATTAFLYDGYNVVQELTAGNPSANLLNGGIDEIFTRTTNGATGYLKDGLGSNIALTNSLGAVSTQYTYEPFGNTSSSGSASTNAFQYTGRENDGTGLYFYRARYYSPAFGRFISEDPIGFTAGDTNLYRYTFDNPISLRDPRGTSICPIHWAETFAAFSKVGLGLVGSAAAAAVCAEDIGTQGHSVSDTRRHAMAGRKNENYQNPCQAFQSTRNFVNGTSDPFAAIHAIQDSYASGHQYQPWNGYTWTHVAGDSVYLPAAEAATEQYLRDLMNGDVQDASAYLYFPSCI